MKYLNIAVRNLSRQKKRNLLLGGAIAFGILMITLLNSFTTGVTRNIKSGLSDLVGGHIFFSQETKREDGEIIEELRDDAPVLEELNALGYGAEGIVQRSSLQATMIFNGREAGQLVQGVDWERENLLQTRLVLSTGSIEAAIADPRGIIISESAAEDLKVELGEVLTLRGETVTGQQNVGSFVVQGVKVDSSFLGTFDGYANIKRVNEMLNLPPESYQFLNLTLPDLGQADGVSDQIYAALSTREQLAPREERNNISLNLAFQDEDEEPWEGSRYVVQNINDFTSAIDQISSTINNIGLGILVILIIITMVGIANTFRMVMFERVKEIGTMRAVGVQRGGVRRIFLWEAFGLGTFGYVLGVLFAILVSLILKIITVPVDSPFNLFTMNGKLTFPFGFSSLAINYVIIIIATILSASFPANKAARSSPADALRS